MVILPRTWVWVAAVGALLAIAGGVLGWVVFPMAVEMKIGEELSLREKTDAWDRFVELPLPLDFKLYVFNVTNPDEVAKGAKPRMQELGPYVYKQFRKKYDVRVDTKEDTVSYYQELIHEFDADRSGNFREDDPVVVLNPVLLGMLSIMENIPVLASGTSLVDQAAPLLFGDTPLFLKTTAGKLLFRGVRIPCGQQRGQPARGQSRGQTRVPQPPAKIAALIVCSSMRRMKLQTISELPGGDLVFSLFGYKNNSFDGRYSVRTGVTTPKLLGQIVSWEGKTSVTAWGAPTCNAINGTQGDIFSPFVTKTTVLEVFSTDICRSMAVRYQQDSEYRGISTYRFGPGPEVMADAVENGDNYCFCPQVAKGLTKENACLKKGALDLSGCQGVPVIVTYPHFYGADPSYLDEVEGVKPIKEVHSMFLDIEPNTGTPLFGGKKIQMNFQMKPMEGVSITRSVRNALVPVAWMYEGAELNDEFIDLLNNLLFNTLKILKGVKIGLLVVGSFLFATGVVLYFLARRRTQADSSVLSNRPKTKKEKEKRTSNGENADAAVQIRMPRTAPGVSAQSGPDGSDPRARDSIESNV